jgi:alkylation response protein AidB-like acyl-CoA dehydrogenase
MNEALLRASTDTAQVHGGYGFIRYHPVEKLMRCTRKNE